MTRQMITSMHIENFKCFKDFDIELGPFNVLIGPNDTGKHPKDVAAVIFGSKAGLGGKYAVVAHHVDLDQLAKTCPKGFAPFADDVRRRIGPVVVGR